MKQTAEFLKRAGLVFSDLELIDHALTHSSWAFEHGFGKEKSNERLEFLGDAVLGLSVSKALYQLEPRLDEGRMTRIRSVLIREETLADLARRIDLGSFLRVGKGEAASFGTSKASNLADAVEAIIGALFLDQGLEVAESWIIHQMAPYFKLALQGLLTYDYKSLFQELVQTEYDSKDIEYRLLKQEGPAHAPIFVVGLYLAGNAMAEGSGQSKKVAEQDASRKALELLNKDRL